MDSTPRGHPREYLACLVRAQPRSRFPSSGQRTKRSLRANFWSVEWHSRNFDGNHENNSVTPRTQQELHVPQSMRSITKTLFHSRASESQERSAPSRHLQKSPLNLLAFFSFVPTLYAGTAS
jgi:hypothetical protein